MMFFKTVKFLEISEIGSCSRLIEFILKIEKGKLWDFEGTQGESELEVEPKLVSQM